VAELVKKEGYLFTDVIADKFIWKAVKLRIERIYAAFRSDGSTIFQKMKQCPSNLRGLSE
jgi:hypothetical protein